LPESITTFSSRIEVFQERKREREEEEAKAEAKRARNRQRKSLDNMPNGLLLQERSRKKSYTCASSLRRHGIAGSARNADNLVNMICALITLPNQVCCQLGLRPSDGIEKEFALAT
jgi:hypothetical protein